MSNAFVFYAALVIVGLFLAVIALGRIADDPGVFGSRRRKQQGDDQ